MKTHTENNLANGILGHISGYLAILYEQRDSSNSVVFLATLKKASMDLQHSLCLSRKDLGHHCKEKKQFTLNMARSGRKE